MTLAGILKLAALFGLDLGKIEQIAATQGLAAAHSFVVAHVQKSMSDAVPGILSNLEKKAPLDGKRRTDKDGVNMSDAEFLLHEADYLLWKAALKVSKVADGFRDSHIVKMWAAVNAQPGETREELLGRLVAEEMRLTF